MTNKRSNKISTLGLKITTVISVGFVLLIVGILLIIGAITSGAADALRQNVNMVVQLNDSVTQNQVLDLQHRLEAAPYVKSVVYHSAESILREESAQNGDIMELLGSNPYSPEFEVYFISQYVNADSLKPITDRLRAERIVSDVYMQGEMIDNINLFLRQVTMVLMGLGLVFLVVSVVLLFNTISLVIYAKRFTIHTMQLVGATCAFVRRPFVNMGLMLGVSSAVLASLILCVLHLYVKESGGESLFAIGWGPVLSVCGILLLLGIIFCGSASYFATNRFLNTNNEELYR